VSESPQTQSIVVLDPSHVPEALVIASAHGVEVEQVSSRGIEPVATVTLVVLGTVAAVGAVVQILEQRKGGQVIDLRPGVPKTFYRTPDLVYGTVVIVAVDGKVTVRVKEPEGMFGKVVSTLPQLLSYGGKTEQVAQAVTEEFGSDVQVESVTLPLSDGGA
jgi:hypothetical protein